MEEGLGVLLLACYFFYRKIGNLSLPCPFRHDALFRKRFHKIAIVRTFFSEVKAFLLVPRASFYARPIDFIYHGFIYWFHPRHFFAVI